MIKFNELSKEEILNKLNTLSNNELYELIANRNNNIKRLFMRDYTLDKEIKDVNSEIHYFEDKIKQIKANNEGNSYLIYQEYLRNLKYNIDQLERINIQLENNVLTTPINDSSEYLNNMIQEIIKKGNFEKGKNKRVSLYIKKEFLHSKNNEIETLKTDIKKNKDQINLLSDNIKLFKEKNMELLTNVSTLKRLYKELKLNKNN